MPAVLIGYRPEGRRGFEEEGQAAYEDVAVVRGASSISEAILATGMPSYGSPHPGNPTALVKRFEPEEIAEDGTFYIRVVWATPGGSTGQSRTWQGVEWTHSMVSQRVVTDLDGQTIGVRHFLKPEGQIGYSKFIHEGAQLGTDIQVAFSQVEILMPLPGQYPAGIVHSLVGRTNGSSMQLDGVQYAEGEVILLGARASRLQPQPFNAYDARYLFAVGRSELPTGGFPRVYANSNDPWPDDTIPLKYGYSFEFRAFNESGSAADSQDSIAEARPAVLYVHRLFRDGNMGQLGVT